VRLIPERRHPDWRCPSKRRTLIRQQVHLDEFDFLIRGQRLAMRQKLPPGDFFVFTSRAERRPKCDVYGWSVRQALPRIPIPLLAPDPDVVLDLHSSFAWARLTTCG